MAQMYELLQAPYIILVYLCTWSWYLTEIHVPNKDSPSDLLQSGIAQCPVKERKGLPIGMNQLIPI